MGMVMGRWKLRRGEWKREEGEERAG